MTSAQLFSNGVCAGSPFPSPPGQTYLPVTANFLCPWTTASGAGLWAFTTTGADPASAGFPGVAYHFILPNDSLLKRVCVKGNASVLGTTNTLLDAGGHPFPVDIDLLLDGVFAQTLVTIPAGATDFELVAGPNLGIGAFQDIQFAADLSSWASGDLTEMIASFGFL